MSAALITASVLSLAGLLASFALGYVAAAPEEILRHATFAIFVTLMTLLAHSMTMFYLIGKGRAIRDAVAEGGWRPTPPPACPRCGGRCSSSRHWPWPPPW